MLFLCGHCFSPVFKKRKREFSAGPKNVTKENHSTNENLMTDLMLKEPNYCKIFCALVGRRFMSYPKLLPQQPLKETHGRSNY